MGWKDDASREGVGNSPKIPDKFEGNVTIAKLVFGSKNNGYFTTSAGDRQIMLIFVDDQDREAAVMYTLNEKARWALAKVLEAAGADLERMDREGVNIDKFTDERFATANLVGRKLRAYVEYEKGKDGKTYTRLNPMRQPVGVGADDDIPI